MQLGDEFRPIVFYKYKIPQHKSENCVITKLINIIKLKLNIQI